MSLRHHAFPFDAEEEICGNCRWRALQGLDIWWCDLIRTFLSPAKGQPNQSERLDLCKDYEALARSLNKPE